MDKLTSTVVEALRTAPCSLRALAREAGVSHVQLLHITQGKRRATSDVAAKVADALDRWSDRCLVAARRIRHSRGRGKQ
ncbi:MAG: helix-turn-helix domain-containing protein [Thermoanaerobaculales bacterium]